MKPIEIKLLLDQIPQATAQMKRVNHYTGAFFESPELRRARRTYITLIRGSRPAKPIEGAVSVLVRFKYSTKTKKNRGKWKTTRPDCDNLVKLLLDCMTYTMFWKDDAQIVRLQVEKKWTDREDGLAEVEIRVSELLEK